MDLKLDFKLLKLPLSVRLMASSIGWFRRPIWKR